MDRSGWIVIPDLHGRRFWRRAVEGHEDDRIVFLGDYLDPYRWEEITPGDSTRELKAVIEFRKAHPDNVVLLLGNHDLGYLDPSVCECRRDIFGAERNRRILEDNLDLFDLVHETSVDGRAVLFTHAGIRQDWVRLNAWLFPEGTFKPERLNTMLHDPAKRDDLMLTLSRCRRTAAGTTPSGAPYGLTPTSSWTRATSSPATSTSSGTPCTAAVPCPSGAAGGAWTAPTPSGWTTQARCITWIIKDNNIKL